MSSVDATSNWCGIGGNDVGLPMVGDGMVMRGSGIVSVVAGVTVNGVSRYSVVFSDESDLQCSWYVFSALMRVNIS